MLLPPQVDLAGDPLAHSTRQITRDTAENDVGGVPGQVTSSPSVAPQAREALLL